MLTIGPDGFRLPAQSRTEVQGTCEVAEPLTVIASGPHMHELGLSLTSTITRADGRTEDMITLTGWDFDSQLFYDMDRLQLQPGDSIQTNCVFENTTDEDRSFGAFTADEMCFNFLFVTLPPASAAVIRTSPTSVHAWPVRSRECRRDAIPVEANPQEGAAPVGVGGDEVPRGDWRLVDYTLVFESADIGIAVLDLDATVINSSGAPRITEEGRIEMDVAGEINTVFSNGGMAAQPVGLSIGGSVTAYDPAAGTLSVALDCPEEGTFNTTFTYEDGKLTFFMPFMRMATGVAVPVFERVE